MRRDYEQGYKLLAQRFLNQASVRELKRLLSTCRNTPNLGGDGASLLIQAELDRRRYLSRPHT